ncbi:MAG: ABC transporter substrate-binding protein [Magnetococcales bacterium]|nr:ABC transporter substrate-binding protein [Magnetococcales bacterium]
MKDSIRLGLMAPLTGLVRMYGREISLAGRIAVEVVNENGGVLGRPLQLVIEDDGSLPDSALVAAEKLVRLHGCSAMIGNLLSNSRIAVAYRVAEAQRIPLLNFSFYEGSILSRYFFHFAALPNQQIEKMIPFMKEKYGPRMFFAGNNYEWPRGSIDAAKKTVSAVGGEVVGEEYLAIGVTREDIECLLEAVARSGADVFVPYFAGSDQLSLLKRFSERGLKRRMAVVMGHFDEVLASLLPAEVRDGYYSSNTYFMSLQTGENRRYLERLSAQPGIDGLWPHGNGVLTNFGEGVYLCVKAFAQAVTQAGSSDSEAIIDALETLTVTGPQGEVRMDPTTHHATVNTFLSRCDAEGRFAIIADFGAIHPIIPSRYNHLRIHSQASREEDIRLQARMLEQMSEGVCLIRAVDGVIVYTNAGFERLFAYESGEAVGLGIERTCGGSDRETKRIHDEIRDHVFRKGTWKGEIHSAKKDGTLFWCSVSITTLTHAEHGEAWITVFKDITERKENERELGLYRENLERMVRIRTEELQKALESSEAGARTKERFLINMSHEIRTPMNGVLGMASLMLRTPMTPRQRHYAETIHRSGRVLLRVINDILDFSKIEAGQLSLEILRFDLNVLISDVASMFSQRARSKGLDFNFNMDEGIPVRLLGDPHRLSQVLFNLLGNAIKFTEKGSVTLWVDADEEREVDVLMRFKIADTGIGISAEFQRNMFQSFSQEDSSISRRFGGTGLGLAITRQLVRLMGGNLEVESVQGRGTSFGFTIRFGKQRQEFVEETSDWQRTSKASFDEGGSFDADVLLVEDNVVNQEVAVAILEQLGCRVTVVGNGQQALNLLCGGVTPFHAVFMDCEMPILDGMEATRRLRLWEKEQGGHVPVIALTAHALPESRRQCLIAGMDDFLRKPFSHGDVAVVLDRLLPLECVLRSGEEEIGRGRAVLEDPVDWFLGRTASENSLEREEWAIPILDWEAVQRIRDLDRKNGGELMEKMIRHYLERTPLVLKELGQALEQGDSGGVRFAAHTLKSSSLVMGAARLAKLGRIMEEEHADLFRVRQHFQFCAQFLDEVALALGHLRQDGNE